MNVRDMSLCVPRDKEETGYGTYVGFVAMGHSWFVPVITNVTGENLQVYGNRYVGGLFGANFPSITQVNVQDSYVKARGYYGGILLGYNGNIYSSCVENSTLEGGALLGGMAGLALNIQNSYVKNVRVEAELGGAGGLGGRMNAAAYTLLNNYVIDSTVISKTGRAGGLYGGTNISATGEPAAPDSSVRTFRNCGVMGSTIVGKEAGGHCRRLQRFDLWLLCAGYLGDGRIQRRRLGRRV